MKSLNDFIEEIEKGLILQSSSQGVINDIDKFCKNNKYKILSRDFPSTSQLEGLRSFNDLDPLVIHIVEQAGKKTHASWHANVIDGREKDTPFFRYLLDQILISTQNNTVDPERGKAFLNYLIDSIKLIKNE